jgi:hypothetical protein
MASCRIFFGMESIVSLHLAFNVLIMNLKGTDYTRLPVIEDYDYLRSIHVPHGVFLSSKIVSGRTDRFSHISEESDTHEDPTQLDSMPTHQYSESPAAGSSNLPALAAPSYLASLPPRELEYYLPVSLSNGENQKISLPPITSLGHPARRPPSHGSTPSGAHYAPLSSEDRRVLDRFRVVL